MATDAGPDVETDAATGAATDAGSETASGPPKEPPVTEPPAKTPPAAVATTEYAPYFYVWGWGNSAYAFTSLVDLQKKAGVNHVTLAFVVSNGGACAASRAIQGQSADIAAFIKAGGRVKASFGGAAGNYIENACTSSTSLATAIKNFVDETGITDLDFDVEQSVAMTSTVNTRRSAALAAVQAARPSVKIAFTLAAMPSGLTAGAFEVVKSAVASKVNISHVNLMTMDYGALYSSGKKMGDLAVAAVNGCAKQLKSVLPALSDDATYGMIGATAMIGQNDVPSEVFSLADAKVLAAFAKARRLGLLSFWAIQRDQPCPAGVDLAVCSGAQTGNYQFSEIFKTAL